MSSNIAVESLFSISELAAALQVILHRNTISRAHNAANAALPNFLYEICAPGACLACVQIKHINQCYVCTSYHRSLLHQNCSSFSESEMRNADHVPTNPSARDINIYESESDSSCDSPTSDSSYDTLGSAFSFNTFGCISSPVASFPSSPVLSATSNPTPPSTPEMFSEDLVYTSRDTAVLYSVV
ncbi:hypothetical protein BU15DRAFT_81320 [Melanogaster broomeanus]|nr:hypothetical protein BU15DRAFT_81320 [Melanogaster broomeanus]